MATNRLSNMATIARTTLAALILLLAVAHDAQAKPGDRDLRFGSKSVFTTKLLDGGFSAALRPDGRILVAGGLDRPGIVRLTPRGRLDRRFGARGRARMRGTASLLPFGLRRDATGELHVAAYTIGVNTPPVELLRFSGTGRGLQRTTHDAFFAGPIRHGIQRRDGGAFVTSADEARAVRPDGTTDTAFGGDGTVSTGVPNDSAVTALALRPDGRLLVAVRGRVRSRLLQFTPQGQPDPAWRANGVRLPFDADSLEVLRNGDVVVARGGPRWIARAIRLTRSGKRRLRFGANGVAGRFRSKWAGLVKDVLQDGRGRIYLLTESKRIGVVALSPRGRRIKRFGRGGRMVFPAPLPENDFPAADEAAQLLPDRRGGMLVIGTRYQYGIHHPAYGCGIRDDFCAEEVELAVWRLKR
ncbi:MAG TPA: hypothetical protein VGW10_02615 [Solirubrobacteraceae bacterium]|nr:hypothetical protein [Solirubrobacteraceae bacterium]